MTDYERGFEHAVRNIVAAVEGLVDTETNPDRKLGIQVALDAAKSYHGFMAQAGENTCSIFVLGLEMTCPCCGTLVKSGEKHICRGDEAPKRRKLTKKLAK